MLFGWYKLKLFWKIYVIIKTWGYVHEHFCEINRGLFVSNMVGRKHALYKVFRNWQKGWN